MKTRMAWIMLCVLCAAPAHAQWNQPVQLTSDTFSNGQADFVVDDSFRIHLFYVSRIHDFPQNYALHYRRFDSWGSPISARMEMVPDTFHDESSPGVLLDRNQNLHVVWTRWYPFFPDRKARAYYARMNPQGEFLTGPYQLSCEECELLYPGGINLVQDCTGVVWVGCGAYYCSLTENGEVITPLRPLTEGLGPFWAEVALLALSPSDEVWACSRITSGGGVIPQNIGVVRLDTTVRQLEVVSPNDPENEIFGMSANAFLIDPAGAFHYVLYRDDRGLFYQRDARDGSPSDTIVLDPDPWGDGATGLTLAGDTLNHLWGQTLPQTGILRVGISLAGERVYGPQFLSFSPSGFGLDSYSRLIWKEGSYWLVGGNFNLTEQRGQVCVIHVPGPNEPPNAIDMRPRLFPDSPRLSVYPNPLNPMGVVVMDLARRGVVSVEVFDVLGRRAANLANGVFEAGRHELNFDARELSTGIYFVQMQTAEQMVTRKAVVVK